MAEPSNSGKAISFSVFRLTFREFRFRFDLGSGAHVIADSSSTDVTDGNVHTVEVDRNRLNVELVVDGQSTSETAGGVSTGLNTNNDVFFGRHIPPCRHLHLLINALSLSSFRRSP